MVAPQHAGLSITRQCRLVSITRSSFYYASRGDSPLNLRLMRRIDEQFLEYAVLRIAPDRHAGYAVRATWSLASGCAA